MPKLVKIFTLIVIISLVLSLSINFVLGQENLPPEPLNFTPEPEGFVQSTPEVTFSPIETSPAQTPVLSPEITLSPTPAPTPTEEEMDEVIKDETVTEEDLGVKTPGRFYFFKKMLRVVQKLATFDPVKKSEIELKEASEELLRAEKLLEKIEGEDKEKIQEKLEKAVTKYEEKIEKINQRTEKIKEKTEEAKDKFLEKIIDRQIKQQKILEKLEEKIPEQAFITIREAREKSLEHFAEVMNKVVEDKEKIAEHLIGVIEQQPGSEFKHFKNLEVLKALEEKVPEEAKEAIRKAQEESMKRFVDQTGILSPEVRAEKFRDYFSQMAGDETRQLKVLEDLKAKDFIPEDLGQKINEVKDLAIEKFEERIKEFTIQGAKEKIFEPLKNGQMADLKVLRELEENVDPEIKDKVKIAIAEANQDSIKKFKEKFIDDPDTQKRAERFEKLAAELRENPNPATFEIIKKLEDELPAEQKAFVEKLKNGAEAGFEQKFRQEGEKFLNRMVTSDPRHLEVLRELTISLPAQALPGIETAIDKQVENIERKIEKMEDPNKFLEFRKKIEMNSTATEEIMKFKPGLMEKMQEKNLEVIKEKFREITEPEKILEFRKQVEEKLNQEKGFKEQLLRNQPNFLKEIDGEQINVVEEKIKGFAEPEKAIEFKKNFELKLEQNPELKRKILENQPRFLEKIETKGSEVIQEKIEQIKDQEKLEELKGRIEKNETLKMEEGLFRRIEERKRTIEEEKNLMPINKPGEPTKPEISPIACIQVITPAMGPEGICKEFPTPCDVPVGWRRVEKCPEIIR